MNKNLLPFFFLLLVFFSSCSYINLNNIEKKIIQDNMSHLVISITTTPPARKSFWYYTQDSIIIFKKTLKNDINRYTYKLYNSAINNIVCDSINLSDVEEEIYNSCGFELDGDELTITQIHHGNTIKKTIYVNVFKFTMHNYNISYINLIKYDILKFKIWP